MLAEHHIVSGTAVAVFVDKDELMAAAIKSSHPGVILDPDTEIFELCVHLLSCGQKLRHVTPVHADKMKRTVQAIEGK
jgi:hypothetical protein